MKLCLILLKFFYVSLQYFKVNRKYETTEENNIVRRKMIDDVRVLLIRFLVLLPGSNKLKRHNMLYLKY